MIQGQSSFLVVSDSHGNTAALTAILAWAQNTGGVSGGIFALDAAIFLGDGVDDLAPASARAGFALPWHTVRGNVDNNSSLPGSMALEIPGSSRAVRKLFLTHGNVYRVGEGCQTLAAAARSNGAEAALYGHTHIPSCTMLDGIFLLNPGSIGRPRSNAGHTFAVLECPAAGPLNARFFSLTSRGRKDIVQELEI
ncbi:MAG: metallophosphoesterase family protein [Spirochaetaceae bacterium]|jgi:putative phosphoesterase|nr:metallophosphoesterase family protein [Spirochaetaceae bacterium]